MAVAQACLDGATSRMDAARPVRYLPAMPIEAMRGDALLTRLAEARHDGDAVATDGDNTLWRGDIGQSMFDRARALKALRPEVAGDLVAEAGKHGVALAGVDASDPHAVAAALNDALVAGTYPGRDAYAMMAWCFAGYTPDEMRAFCEASLDDFGFADAVFPHVPQLISFCREHGHAFWLVSASPGPLVRVAAQRLGIPESQGVGMEPEVKDGRLQPRLESEPTYAEGKVRRLRLHTDAPLLAGCGDSLYDAALIAEARVQVGVGPSDALRAKLEEMPAAVALEV